MMENARPPRRDIRRLRERIGATGEADAVTEDLLIGLIAELEKQSWMFRAENRA